MNSLPCLILIHEQKSTFHVQVLHNSISTMEYSFTSQDALEQAILSLIDQHNIVELEHVTYDHEGNEQGKEAISVEEYLNNINY